MAARLSSVYHSNDAFLNAISPVVYVIQQDVW